MKGKFLATLTVLLISSQAFAQRDSISEFFSELEDDRANTIVHISGMMFNLFSNLEAENEEDQAALDAMSKLTGLKILTKEHVDDGFADYKAALKKLPSDEFRELMNVREEDSDFSFFVREKNGRVTELLMVSGGYDSFFLLSIVGDIDLEQISKISKNMEIEGLEDLDKIDEREKDKNKN